MTAPDKVFIHHADQIEADGTQCLVFKTSAPVNFKDSETAYTRTDCPKALAQALLDMWQPANVTQLAHPDGVPFRKYLQAIISQSS